MPWASRQLRQDACHYLELQRYLEPVLLLSVPSAMNTRALFKEKAKAVERPIEGVERL